MINKGNGQGELKSLLQESDSVDNLEDMEESCEDSDFLDLVSQGNESHPLVKFTRLVQNKKAEFFRQVTFQNSRWDTRLEK